MRRVLRGLGWVVGWAVSIAAHVLASPVLVLILVARLAGAGWRRLEGQG